MIFVNVEVLYYFSSVAGIIGLPNYSQYSATKRAVISLAESLKSELIDYGVFVGINYPGFTENEEHKTIINSEGGIRLVVNDQELMH